MWKQTQAAQLLCEAATVHCCPLQQSSTATLHNDTLHTLTNINKQSADLCFDTMVPPGGLTTRRFRRFSPLEGQMDPQDSAQVKAGIKSFD